MSFCLCLSFLVLLRGVSWSWRWWCDIQSWWPVSWPSQAWILYSFTFNGMLHHKAFIITTTIRFYMWTTLYIKEEKLRKEKTQLLSGLSPGGRQGRAQIIIPVLQFMKLIERFVHGHTLVSGEDRTRTHIFWH